MSERRDSIGRTLTVAVVVSLVCSVFVSTAAVMLEPRREANRQLAIQNDILDVAGLPASAGQDDAAAEKIEPRLIDLSDGGFVDADPAEFDERRAARDPDTSIDIAPDQDVAQIKRRAQWAKVYLVRDQGRVNAVVLPIHGYGLWSTMYGLLAVERDGETVRALKFYEHAETPGLGDQIERPAWRAQFEGKKIYGPGGSVALGVVKGAVAANDPLAAYHVDGLSGATLTGNGVGNTLRYWLGDQGYGPFLARLREGGLDQR